jgi:protein O-mannosyl-transferase
MALSKNMAGKKPIKKNIENSRRTYLFLSLLLLIIITLFCYKDLFRARFTNWDDPSYVLKNPMVRSLSGSSVAKMFSEPSAGNYHPLTILSLAIDYSRATINPETKLPEPYPFHFTNILLHLFNVLLVFLFIYLLSNRKWLAAFIVAFLFSVHPMHVESVAWISGRKDLLFTFFFILSMIFYLRYCTHNRKLFYFLSFLLFLLSILSKPAAAPMAFILLITDYYTDRTKFLFTRTSTWKLNRDKAGIKILLEKVPYFLAGFVVLFITYEIQKITAVTDIGFFPLFYRFLFAGYGFFMYLLKMIFPLGLSALYPYPSLPQGTFPPVIFYLATIFSAGIFVTVFLAERRSKLPVFGLLFYLFMILLVLQFVSVGKAIMADRYTYVSYLGPFFVIAMGFDSLLRSARKNIAAWKYPLSVLMIAYMGWMLYTATTRTAVWDNSLALWNDTLEKFPHATTALKNRAVYYLIEQDKPMDALPDYETLASLGSKDPDIYNNLGYIYDIKGEYQAAVEAYTRALELNGNSSGAYINRANAFVKMKKFPEAFADYDRALQLSPDDRDAYADRARAFMASGQTERAIRDFDYLVAHYPAEEDYLFKRGLAYMQKASYPEAILDFSRCLKLRPGNANILFNIGYCYNSMKDYKNAYLFIRQAHDAGYPVDERGLKVLEEKQRTR